MLSYLGPFENYPQKHYKRILIKSILKSATHLMISAEQLVQLNTAIMEPIVSYF